MAEKAPDLTPFRYAFNNPINVIDPDGNFEQDDFSGSLQVYGGQGGERFSFSVSGAIGKNSGDIRVARYADGSVNVISETEYSKFVGDGITVESNDVFFNSQQKTPRPEKISFSKSKIDVLSAFIAWYRFADIRETERGVLKQHDIINYKQSKRKRSIEERYLGMGSMTSSPTTKYYSDADGDLIMSFDSSLGSGKQRNKDSHRIIYAEGKYSGTTANGKSRIYFFQLTMQNGTPALQMRITGRKLYSRIFNSVKHGDLFMGKKINKN